MTAPVLEELDWQQTPLGEISLRRRSEPLLDHKLIYEAKLGDEFLMSSLFVEAEEQLARLALQRLSDAGNAENLSIVVGGLGLGYTAASALEDARVAQLVTIELLAPVISWHQRGLLPLGDRLHSDPRSTLLQQDFFSHATSANPWVPGLQQADAVLLDIDHSPQHWLDDSNQAFYTASSLTALNKKIRPGGVFGLWSNDPPDTAFCALLSTVFSNVIAEQVNFNNPDSGGESANTVYLASRGE